MNRLLFILSAAVMLCSVSSCNLWRRVTGRQATPVADSATVRADSAVIAPDTAIVHADSVVIPAPETDAERLTLLRTWLPLWNARTEYATFSGRAKVDYEGGGESHEVTANIRIERDRRIWVSITALLGIEVVRALITPDTIIAINRLQKYVHVLPFSEANTLLPVQTDFATLQSLIIGDVLPAGHPLSAVADSGDVLVLSSQGTDYAQQVAFSRQDTSIRDQKLASDNALLQATYSGYGTIGGRRFAGERELLMTDKSGQHRIRLEFSKVSFDEPVDMSFSIPSKYERR